MSAYVGRTCPYCQFPLKPSDNVRVCGQCGMPHHRDCWDENGGCTTYGCAGAPADAGSAIEEDESILGLGICPYCDFPIDLGEEVVTCEFCGIPHHSECWDENGGCTTYGCTEAPACRALAADEGFSDPEGEQARSASWQAEQLEADQGAGPVSGRRALWPAAQPQSASGERTLLPIGLAVAGVVILAVSILTLGVYRGKAVRDIEERLQAYRSAAAVSLPSEDVGEDLSSRISAYDSAISSLEPYVSALAVAEKTIESWWPHLPTDRRELDDIRCERKGIQAVLDALYTKRSEAQERLEQERQVEEQRRRRQAEILYRLWLYEQEMRQYREGLYSGEEGDDSGMHISVGPHPFGLRLDGGEEGIDGDGERHYDGDGYLDPDSTAEDHGGNSEVDGYGGTLPDHLSPGW